MRPLGERNQNGQRPEKEQKGKKRYIIEFNKKLSTKFHQAHLNNTEIPNPNHLKAEQSYFNFDNDKIEFQLKCHYALALKIKIKSFSVIYSIKENLNLNIPIIFEDHSERQNNFVIFKIDAGFKDRLLDLFSFLNKSFKLFIEYSIDKDQNYKVTFVTPVPILDNLEDYKPTKKFTGIFMPEDMPNGKEMMRLFKNRFSLKDDFTDAEARLQQDLIDFTCEDSDEKSQSDNFVEMLRNMLMIEDLEIMKQMAEYNLEFQKVLPFRDCRYTLRQTIEKHLKYIMCDEKRKRFQGSIFIIEATHKMPVDVMEFELVYITDMFDYQQYHDDLAELKPYRIVARVCYIFDNLIIVQVKPSRNRRQRIEAPQIDSSRSYHVEFIPNRVAIRVAHRALADLKETNMTDYLKNFDAPNVKSRFGDFEDFEWFNNSIDDNEEQQTAIINIVNCTSYPSPYVIFGGPGTGKSSTVVEAIAQIVKLKPKAHILVTASSNMACDDIGNRLLKYVSKNKILRLYSPSFDHKPDKLNSNLQEISNFRSRNLCDCNKRSCPENEPLDDPSYEEFYTARVVIVTLVSCGRVVSAGINPDHFEYIFIDEAAAECEQRTLIPIVGLGLSLNQVNAQIVLCGDHKQLGAIVVNSFARKMGMEMSLMERLMETDEKYELLDGEYDQEFVTQLKKNYRNHPSIMKFSNENFYNSQLISCCSEEILNFAKDPELLIFNPDFPIIFHTTKSPSKEVGTSLKNEAECALLGYYLNAIILRGINGNKVAAKDIGIISPYRGQRDIIIENYQQKYPKLEIGTVDAFQGREKKIIIMSCVRSQTKHVGFLRNEKRLNVALTRAKALLIIIGNASTLQTCSIWNKFISSCYENRGIVGDNLAVNYPGIVDESKAGKEEIPNGVDEEYQN